MMEQTFDVEKPTQKIYKLRAIEVATALGGPLVTGYLIAENFKAFNEADKLKKTWFYAIMASIVIFGGLAILPENIVELVPAPVIPFINAAIASFIVRHHQGKNIAAHTESGRELFGWGRTIAVSIIGAVVTVIMVMGGALLYDTFVDDSISTKTYGLKKHEINFYADNITEPEVDAIADGLTKATFFDLAVTKYVYVEKNNDAYELSISVDETTIDSKLTQRTMTVINGEVFVDESVTDSKALQSFIELRNDLQKQFPDNKIAINLVVDFDNVIKRIE
jgi:hypothetical protein